MSEYSTGNAPGFQTQQDSQESEVLWSGRKGQDLVATKKITLLSSTVDSGNTPTTTVRGGNVIGIVDATGKANTYSPDANDGRQIAVGILEHNAIPAAVPFNKEGDTDDSRVAVGHEVNHGSVDAA